MSLEFERGESSRPKGHALAYYRDAGASGDVYATYLIVPPIAIDLAKYMPPMFSQKISLADMESVSAVPLPPVPEKAESVEHLHALAGAREDDLVFLGTMNPGEVQEVLVRVTEAAQEYLRLYNAYAASLPPPEAAPAAEGPPAEGVQDVLYSLMSERDRLAELSRLLGRLRYAVEVGDPAGVEEAQEEAGRLARHFPSAYRIDQLLEAARTPGPRGARLCELRMTRCYRLCDEDYRGVEALDAEIDRAEAEADG